MICNPRSSQFFNVKLSGGEKDRYVVHGANCGFFRQSAIYVFKHLLIIKYLGYDIWHVSPFLIKKPTISGLMRGGFISWRYK